MRYLVLTAAVALQMCLGATYSWSVFVQPLKQVSGLAQGPVQLPFTVFYFVFPATAILAGHWIGRLGPRFCAMAGGLLFGGGWLVAGLGRIDFAFTVIGVGLISGIGVGLAYLTPIACGMLWFPKHQGLVTGIAVAGFGGGAALVSQAAGRLINGWGLSPFDTLVRFGLIFMAVTLAAGFWMKGPADPPTQRPGPSPRPRDLIGQPRFRRLYLAMMAGLAAGFCVNANLRELFTGQSAWAATTAVAVFALANAAGRIVWGFGMDRLAAARAIAVNLALQAAVLLASFALRHHPVLFLAFAFLAGFNYGGVLVIYAASASRIWGKANVGPVYGLLFSANIPAALAPLIAGLWYDARGSFALPLTAIAAVLLAAALWVGRCGNLLADGHDQG